MNELQTKPMNGLRTMAETFIRSGLAPASVSTPEKAMIIAAAGQELGIPFMASMRSINVIQNRPSASVQLKLALAMRTGELEDFKIERKQDEVLVTIKRKGRSPLSMGFGKKEATALKLIGKDNYDKQPMTMYQWRALGAALDICFADVLLGMGTDVSSSEPQQLMDSQFVEPQATTIPSPIIEEKPFEVKSKEINDLILDITEKLGQMNKGNMAEMNQQLRKLTAYTSKQGEKKWVELEDLEQIERVRPLWIVSIHKKVSEAFEKFPKPEPVQTELLPIE